MEHKCIERAETGEKVFDSAISTSICKCNSIRLLLGRKVKNKEQTLRYYSINTEKLIY